MEVNSRIDYNKVIKHLDSVDKKHPYFVYRLVCPKTYEVKYIGVTKDVQTRYRKHLKQLSSRTLKNNWIKSILKKQELPIMIVIDSAKTRGDINSLEKYWIIKHKDWGFCLKNMTDGGDGGDTMSGRKLTPEQCLKISQRNKGRVRPDLSESNKEKKSKSVLQINPENGAVIERFESVRIASELTGCSRTNIAKFASGNIKPTIKKVGGFWWKYEEVNNVSRSTI